MDRVGVHMHGDVDSKITSLSFRCHFVVILQDIQEHLFQRGYPFFLNNNHGGMLTSEPYIASPGENAGKQNPNWDALANECSKLMCYKATTERFAFEASWLKPSI